MEDKAQDMLNMLNALDDGEQSRDNYVRSPFGFIGGKGRSLDKILPHLPLRRTYVEVFGGSGAVLLARKPSRLEVFNDRHSGIVSFYRCIRDRQKMSALVERLKLCLHAREEFIYCRDTWRDCTDDIERAARWYYMVQMSFGCKGQSFGRSKGKNISPIIYKISNQLPRFQEVHFRLQKVQIENLDWRLMLKDYDDYDTVFYLDPPYYNVGKGTYEHELTKDDHKELLDKIFQCKGFVALSGYNNPLYESYQWDHRYEWEHKVYLTPNNNTDSSIIKFGDTTSGKLINSLEVLWIKE